MTKNDIKTTERVFERLKENGFKADLFLPGRGKIALFNIKKDEKEIKKISDTVYDVTKNFRFIVTEMWIGKMEDRGKLVDINIVDIRE